MESPLLPLFFSLCLSCSLAHASVAWLMAGDQSKSAWETEYFSGKIIPLDLVCKTKAVLCFTLTLHWRWDACCASGSGFLGTWIKNMIKSMWSTRSCHTFKPTHTHTYTPKHTRSRFYCARMHTQTLSTYHYMHALNFGLTLDFQLTVLNFELMFCLI